MNKNNKSKKYENRPILRRNNFIILLLVTLLFMIVLVEGIGFDSSVNEMHYFLEDNLTGFYNLSADLTSPAEEMSFFIDSDTLIKWNSQNVRSNNIVSEWISLSQTTGILTLNATQDNQTGKFEISIQVNNITDEVNSAIAIDTFSFTINATNDAPDFTLNNSYNTSVTALLNSSILITINGTDEELQYPLILNNITSLGCSNAQWSTRNGNCNLSFTNYSNSTIVTINFTNLSRNDVGQYNISICLNDTLNQSNLPNYPDATYSQNKTTCKNTTINVEQALTVDISNCTNSILQENQSFTCQINVTTRGQVDNLRVWTNATLRNTGVDAANSSWFFSLNNSNSTNFTQTYYINVTPTKREIGNWTINFTARDLSTEENKTEQIYIYTNRTTNALPLMGNLDNVTTSANLQREIYFNVSDNDLLILDKAVYDELILFTTDILNLSDPGQIITNFANLTIISLGIIDNITRAKLTFTGSDSEAGNYLINITSSDEEGATASSSFGLTILSNNFPVWQGSAYFNLTVNSTLNTTRFFYANLTNSSEVVFAYDSDIGDSLTFTNSSGAMLGFNLSSNGTISFTPYKRDVGFWNFSVTASDNLGLSSINYFVFNISNINSLPILGNLAADNASVSGNNISAIEDNITTIFVSVYDDDSLINKSVYNETFNLSITILNLSLNNINFSFIPTGDSFDSNETMYYATFTPNRTNVGAYNVTLNVTDRNGTTASYNFNLNIAAADHSPTINSVPNQTTSTARVFSYNFSASDIEDGSSENNSTFVFNLSDSDGTLNFNSTNFNQTTGRLNISFNSNQAGVHLIYLNVSDSSQMNSSTTFWISIYNIPNITLPVSEEIFNTSENLLYNLTFAINHSVEDALNYSFYLNSVLLNNSYSICNGNNNTFTFIPNFTQESYGNYSNLTLFAFNPLYPELNYTKLVYFNITHTNYPINTTTEEIGPSLNGTASYELNLTDYFLDYDAQDEYYKQKIGFIVNNLSGGDGIVIAITNWTNGTSPKVVFNSTIESQGNYSITAYEYNQTNDSQIIANITGNNFSLTLNIVTEPEPDPAPTPSSGGSGGSTTINTVKLLAASEATINKKGYIEFPFEIINTGESTLTNINLTSIIQKEISQDINLTLSKDNIASLLPGSSKKVSLYISVDTEKEGKYNLFLYANVSSPKISDWAEISLNIIKSQEGEAEKMIIFTEKLIAENPECLELKEIFEEAERLFETGDYAKSLETSEKIVESCKKAMSRNSQIRFASILDKNYANYLLFILITLAVFLVYFIYQRARFKNKYRLEE